MSVLWLDFRYYKRAFDHWISNIRNERWLTAPISYGPVWHSLFSLRISKQGCSHGFLLNMRFLSRTPLPQHPPSSPITSFTLGEVTLLSGPLLLCARRDGSVYIPFNIHTVPFVIVACLISDAYSTGDCIIFVFIGARRVCC